MGKIIEISDKEMKQKVDQFWVDHNMEVERNDVFSDFEDNLLLLGEMVEQHGFRLYGYSGKEWGKWVFEIRKNYWDKLGEEGRRELNGFLVDKFVGVEDLSKSICDELMCLGKGDYVGKVNEGKVKSLVDEFLDVGMAVLSPYKRIEVVERSLRRFCSDEKYGLEVRDDEFGGADDKELCGSCFTIFEFVYSDCSEDAEEVPQEYFGNTLRIFVGECSYRDWLGHDIFDEDNVIEIIYDKDKVGRSESNFTQFLVSRLNGYRDMVKEHFSNAKERLLSREESGY